VSYALYKVVIHSLICVAALPDLEKGFQAAFDKADEKESQVLAGRLRQEVEYVHAIPERR